VRPPLAAVWFLSADSKGALGDPHLGCDIADMDGKHDRDIVEAAVQRLLQRAHDPTFAEQLNRLRLERASLQAIQSANDAELGRLWSVVGAITRSPRSLLLVGWYEVVKAVICVALQRT
jgi:hypothetical protein